MNGRASRKITGRTIVSCTLVLDTPAHFGNGDVAGSTDMPLLRDPGDGITPLLTGSSIAGALRCYLRELENGYGKISEKQDYSERLFGGLIDATTNQSWLLIDDALGKEAGIELRDGVSLEASTRTAKEGMKYDIELLAAGTTFPITMEFLHSSVSKDLLPAFAMALHGFSRGEIGLGQRKRRGYGRCHVSEWNIRQYSMVEPTGMIAWLNDDLSTSSRGSDIFKLLGIENPLTDNRDWFQIEACFQIPDSLIIRSYSESPGSPDMSHLHSLRSGKHAPIISGTSLAGAVRARSLRIANTILGEEKAGEIVESMFGKGTEKKANSEAEDDGTQDIMRGSRVVIQESQIKGGSEFVVNRVKIDRFTGGAFPSALFSEQPLFGGSNSEVVLRFILRNPEMPEIGLLLLVLKDLWTGDLPIGGESAVGRGRLKGKWAILDLRLKGKKRKWKISESAEKHLDLGDDSTAAELEEYVAAFWAQRR